jgi:hypothetical protein
MIIDFDAAAPFGETLAKGRSRNQVSDPENDFDGLRTIHDFLMGLRGDPTVDDDRTPTGEA